MDGADEQPNFLLEISLDSDTEDVQIEELPVNYADDSELSNFLSNLQRTNANAIEESNQAICIGSTL